MDDPAVGTVERATRQEISARPSPRRRVADIWRYRELLGNLVRKELKVKYKNSTLGFLWSLLNPILYLVVFWVVFDLVLGSGIEDFPIFLLAGLLPWNLFSTSLGSATSSVVANASLVNKVYFPREILPLAGIGAALVHFFLQAVVLIGALAVFRYAPAWEYLPVVVLALAVLLVLGAALGIALAAINVYLRDTQHLLELVLLAWFWITPIVYQYKLLSDKLQEKSVLLLVNPMTSLVLAFQRGIYNRVGGPTTGGRFGGATQSSGILPDASLLWYLRNVAVVGVVSVALLVGALWLFGRLEDNFSEEL
ncbi:MAG: ABC transporter permease [Actinomycetota bacterium]|nr:ABC transporter permease [Actinomycetota bacterium]